MPPSGSEWMSYKIVGTVKPGRHKVKQFSSHRQISDWALITSAVNLSFRYGDST